ncbi:hypothetical protein [Jiella flava]|uniref:Uncharacterized protein n=1 Tax=Jiella flava TaxID=2816857 RepID=A0A939G3U5_9HYPH|nr:hypothetical protein [Jiella flava]MBO0664574.1 hypothetical protein [Jiella flava]
MVARAVSFFKARYSKIPVFLKLGGVARRRYPVSAKNSDALWIADFRLRAIYSVGPKIGIDFRQSTMRRFKG